MFVDDFTNLYIDLIVLDLDSLNAIKEEIAVQTGISSTQQILILGNRVMTDALSESNSVNLNDSTTHSHPLLLLTEGNFPSSKALVLTLRMACFIVCIN